MESNHIAYDYLKSFDRIDKIISENDYSYEEFNYIPSRDKLTFNNGFYVDCSTMFVDIRGSSDLPSLHKRPKLAKLYRAYVSEIVAVINGNPLCVEVNIVGDCVSGIFDTKYQNGINSVFATAFTISSLISVMNCKFKKNDIETIRVGIGISYGRALMIKAGYNGSGINDVVWMGDVVNEASKLCSYGDKDGNGRIVVSSVFYSNLNQDNQKLLRMNYYPLYYHGDVGSEEMDEWYGQNCM
jgi:class 3 adenylate cyclase